MPMPIIMLLSLGFNPYVDAKIAPVIIGAIAASMIETSTISPCPFRINLYKNKSIKLN